MKYEVLYNRVRSGAPVAFLADGYPEEIILPIDGYIVPHPATQSVAYDADFDEQVDNMLDASESLSLPFIIIEQHDEQNIVMDCGVWFKSKEYAFGYADGIKSDVVFDAFNSKFLFRGDKEFRDDCV